MKFLNKVPDVLHTILIGSLAIGIIILGLWVIEYILAITLVSAGLYGVGWLVRKELLKDKLL